MDRNNYCKDCERSIYEDKSCDINVENKGKYVMAGDKCYCKIVQGEMAEKYSWNN